MIHSLCIPTLSPRDESFMEKTFLRFFGPVRESDFDWHSTPSWKQV
jgi:hypothetical protein